jgi:hypothetical protein
MTETEIEAELREALIDGEWHPAENVVSAIRKSSATVSGFDVSRALRAIGGISRTTTGPGYGSQYVITGFLATESTELKLPK